MPIGQASERRLVVQRTGELRNRIVELVCWCYGAKLYKPVPMDVESTPCPD